ncbi:MAG TPA: hypothetical protein DCQ47_00650, partial [Gammaproteobacteria bacterium]|nr:hypothetical protein [Gammaproteobacteria bacterium]
GQIPKLQVTGFLDALETLVDETILSLEDGQQLRDDYLWLRHVEHVIQAENDQQTQDLPTDCGRLSTILGFATADQFENHRREVTDRVHEAFTAFMHVESTTQNTCIEVKDEVRQRLDSFTNNSVCER